MNIRSLTRGDGVVIGAAVLLFIASFLDTFDCKGSSCDNVPNAWDNGNLIMSVYLAGIIAAGLIIASRALPEGKKVAGLELGPAGVVVAIFAAWSSLGAIFDPAGSFDDLLGLGGDLSAGVGLILGLIAALALAAAAVATPLVPALKAPLVGAPRPQVPPYGGQPQGGYGYPGAQQQPYGGQQPPQQNLFGAPAPAPQPPAGAGQPGPAPAAASGDFSPFWFAVPVPRPLYPEDGSPTPIAELAPGTWYLAVEQRGPGLIAQTQDGRRGVLQDTTGIQRG
ncbi:DUF5336 domain-containing protein [Streptomyces sp. NPDC091292]|uniref:DUF5336 domain-containing protein n=1 Tax=Streptomyces sp. NPDC091292 TaxID=3365991 RepID=UPI003800C491